MTDSEITLFERYLLGELSLPEKAELARRLDSEIEFQTAFMNYVEDSQELAELSRDAKQREASPPNSLASVTQPQNRPTIAWLAAAALVTLLAIGSWRLIQQSESERNWTPATIGRLVASEGGDFVKNEQVFHPGDLIPAGRYGLEKGIAKIVFDNGSSVTLTGPADVAFVDISSLKVFRGKLTGEAPGEGIRLKVTTPDLEVIDLGTRFGLEIDAAGATEVHVLEGTVQITRKKGKKKGLKQIFQEGFATVLAPGENQSLQSTTIDPGRFSAAPPNTPSEPTAWLHYSFDGSGLDWLEDRGSNLPNGPFPLSPEFPPGNVTQMNGRFGQAAAIQRFQEREDTLQSNFNGIGGNRPRTVALWVKVSEQDRTLALAGWGRRRTDATWQLALHRHAASNELVLRTAFFNGYVLGSTNIADGTWHHLVSVYLGGDHGSMPQRIRHYVDGRLEEISSTDWKKSKKVEAEGSPNFGFFLGYQLSKTSFTGLMDEVFVFDRALGPDEIRKLYETNQIDL
jgi:ferric-dicitrate binding protein FerR (iron transport regulator)